MNLLNDIPTDFPNEIFEEILLTQTFKIERIISHGHITPQDKWYDQQQHEWVLLLEGAARVEVEVTDLNKTNRIVDLEKGDYLNIPAHIRHRVIWTDEKQPTIWLAIHYDRG